MTRSRRVDWQWKVLLCPHCREELRTRIICVNAERKIDLLHDAIQTHLDTFGYDGHEDLADALTAVETV